MPSKGVVDRRRVANRLIAAARTHAHEVGVRLPSHFAAVLAEGETLPDMIRLQLHLARLLEERLDALVEADAAHRVERSGDPEVRGRRDDAAAAVYDRISSLRAAVRVAYGVADADELLQIEGPTPEDPSTLQRLGRRLVVTLRRLPSELPAPRVTGIDLDLSAAAGELQSAVEALDRALEEVACERRRLQSTQRRKDRAVVSFDRAVQAIAPVLKGLYRLAGLLDVADGIRATLPSTRAATAVSRKEG